MLIPQRKFEAGEVGDLLQTANYIGTEQLQPLCITSQKISFTAYDVDVNTLDDIGDGTTYSKVLTTDISAGHIKLTECTGDLDDIGDGSTYGKVKSTDITSGYIKLTTEQNLDGQGLRIVSNSGTTYIDIKNTHIAGYSSGVLQFEIKASDGKGYFGAGKCIMDSTGIRLSNDDASTAFLHLGSVTYEASIYKETGSAGKLVLNPGTGRKVYTTRLEIAIGGTLQLPRKVDTGDPTAVDGFIYINDYDNAIRCYADGAWRDVITW